MQFLSVMVFYYHELDDSGKIKKKQGIEKIVKY